MSFADQRIKAILISRNKFVFEVFKTCLYLLGFITFFVFLNQCGKDIAIFRPKSP